MKALPPRRTQSPAQRANSVALAAKASTAHHVATLREGEAQDRELFGELLPDVLFLRRRNFSIVRAGKKACFIIDEREVDAEGLQAIAARERRLAGIAPVDPKRGRP